MKLFQTRVRNARGEYETKLYSDLSPRPPVAYRSSGCGVLGVSCVGYRSRLQVTGYRRNHSHTAQNLTGQDG